MRRLALLLTLLSLPSLTWAEEVPFTHEGRAGTVRTLLKAGDPDRALDLVIVADAYKDSRSERRRLEGDAETILSLFDDVEPFASYRGLFNVSLVWLPSKDSLLRVELPHAEPRNLMTFDHHALQRLLNATGLVWDAVHVLHDQSRFGGTAYRGQAISITTRNSGSLNRERKMGLVRVLAHELGHAWGGLVEERPGELACCGERQSGLQAGELPNAFALAPGETVQQARARIPWAAWLDETPAIEPASRRETYPFSAGFDPDEEPVGLFAGAGSLKDGGLRAQEHCLMRSDAGQFCVVCREAMVLAIHRLANASVLEAEAVGDQVTLTLTSLLPADQRDVTWTVEGDHMGLAAQLVAANAQGAERVTVGRDQVAAVRCLVRDTTPWVRRVELEISLEPPTLTEPSAARAPTGGAAQALGGLGF